MRSNNDGIDYILLSSLLGQVIEEAKLGQSECKKEHPGEVEICDHAVENLGSLLDQISVCVFPRHFRSIQGRDCALRKDIVDKYDSIKRFSES